MTCLEMQANGLETLAAAAEMLQQERPDKPHLDLVTERDKRKMIERVRQFELKQQKQALPALCNRRHKPVIRDVSDELLGNIVWKKFLSESGKPRWYQGEVVSVCRVKRGRFVHSFGVGVTSTVKYTVLYQDGDSEDMTREEVLKHLIK